MFCDEIFYKHTRNGKADAYKHIAEVGVKMKGSCLRPKSFSDGLRTMARRPNGSCPIYSYRQKSFGKFLFCDYNY